MNNKYSTDELQIHRREIRRIWRHANKDKVSKSNADYYQRNKDRAQKRSKLWAKNHRDKVYACCKRWRKNHAPENAAREARRYARKRNSVLPGDQWEITEVYARAAWWRKQGFIVEVDHIYPVGFGWHEPSNLQIIYKSENAAKGARCDYIPQVIFV
jgi:hypothetical protein